MRTLIGSNLPEFKAEVFVNGQIQPICTEDLKGKWGVLFFYPADFTFVCPTELGDVADQYDAIKEMGVEVYSVSCDTAYVHKAWHDASETIKKIKYPMIGDPAGVLSKELGVYIKEAGICYRATFIFNPEGKIVAYEVHDNGIGRDSDELVRKLAAAKFVAAHGDKVCPAKWKPGKDTLTPGVDLVGKI